MVTRVKQTSENLRIGEGKPGPGRPKGQPNKATADLKAMIEGALSDAGGRKYLRTQAQANPAAFLSLVSKLLPKDINAHHSGQIDIRAWLQKLGEPD